MRVRLHLALIFALLVPCSGDAMVVRESSDRPNIVVFLVDDLGWLDTSVPLAGEPMPQNTRYATPNVARLAKSGVRFTQAYACPVCSPSRTSFLTGQNAARHHVTQWTREKDADPSAQGMRLLSPPDWKRNGLQPGGVTLPGALRDAGYRTIHVGKAHFGARSTPGEAPENLGFDISIAGHAAGAPGSYQGENGYGAANPVWAVPELEAYHGLPVHLTDALTIEANRAVEGAVKDGKPFFLYLAHYAVHVPLEPHAPYIEKYRAAGLDEKEARYASMIEGVDRSLGAVLVMLDRLRVAERTLVIFASDNGGLATEARGSIPFGDADHSYNFPLRAGKGNAYEGGTRIPQIVAFAKTGDDEPLQARIHVARDFVCDAPTIIEDLFPTILELAGASVPASHVVDGHSIVPLLDPAAKGNAEEFAFRRERPLLVHYPHVWGPKGKGYEPFTWLRVGDFKLIWLAVPRRYELYDLAHDLGENHDLAAQQQERVKTLSGTMLELLASRDAQYPIDRESLKEERPLSVDLGQR